ncbi:radical SAM protein [Deltaproteobacteria bacterium]|nr:radical SAM protein [Deltaproteobacteria bacterium]
MLRVPVRFVGKVYRPPSEADALLLQASIGCSHNRCTYCDMYRDKPVFRPRPVEECLEDLRTAGAQYGSRVQKLFVTDGDALVLPVEAWERILGEARRQFPALRRVSCYAMARNVLDHGPEALAALRAAGLTRLYIGPESGDDVTLRRIAKGSNAATHVEAARLAHEAGMELSVIFLLGAGGVERSAEHAIASAALATAMNPAYLSALTLTVVPGTPLHRLEQRGSFVLPDVPALLGELRTFVALASPDNAVFRTNHASNYLPIAGNLPTDRDRILRVLDGALGGSVALRPEWSRGL